MSASTSRKNWPFCLLDQILQFLNGGGAFYQLGDLLELHLRQCAGCHAFAEAGQRLRNALPCVGLRFLSLSLAILCIGLRNQNHVSMSTVTATTTVS